MASGGTEAFPDLGKHCQHIDCNLLDFLPFTCDGCKLVFCLEHRSYKSHACPNSDHKSRKVVVCETCSVSIEVTGHHDNEDAILERHHKSGKCDPKNKKKSVCPVKRCKGILTFSNTSTCKTCHMKVCLKHRFPADHDCGKRENPALVAAAANNGGWNERFMAALVKRSGQECGKSGRHGSTSPPSTPSVKAC